ncbi:MAG: hypothetical protein O7G85_03005, partial [Planctomycetota bacterium]|nr:hypothetical protein [Planctomycetota bacterium]
CGYDLRGTMGDWTNACPLRGVCSECGLGFDWADMIGSSKRPSVRIANAVANWFGVSPGRTRSVFRRVLYLIWGRFGRPRLISRIEPDPNARERRS